MTATYADADILTVQDILRAGLSLSDGLVEPTETDGNKFRNDGKTFLYAENRSGSDVTVTFDCPHVIDGQSLAELAVVVKATGDASGLDKQLIGPFTAIFNQTDGYVWVTCSAVTDMLLGVFRLANP